MKRFLCTLLLLAGVFVNAQNWSFLPECKDAEFPKNCTTKKIETDINNLVTNDMLKIVLATGKEHFVVEVIFIVDENGKIIPAETRFLTEIESLKKPLENYLANLPTFIPKGSSAKERRELYMISLNYIRDNNGQNYHIADDWEMIVKNIKRDYIKFDEYPVYPGCEGTKGSNQECMTSLINRRIAKTFRIPGNAPDGQVNMMEKLIITDEGKIEIGNIVGGSEDFRKEIKRIFKSLPKVSPAKISGIPISISFNLPVTINIS